MRTARLSGREPEEAAIAGTSWTSDECAAHWGVKTTTWLGYVSRGQAPAPLPGPGRRRYWDADEVRAFSRPGAGRSRAGAGDEAQQLLERMREAATRIEELRERQRELLRSGREQGLEIRAMSRASGISPQTAYSWLES